MKTDPHHEPQPVALDHPAQESSLDHPWPWRAWLAHWMCALLMLVHSSVFAETTLHLDVATDPSGTATLADMLTREDPWRPVTGLYSGGYTRTAMWFRLQFVPGHDNAANILWIQPTPLDQLTLYGLSPEGTLAALDQTGDQTPSAERTLQTTAMGFVLDEPAGKTYFIRLQTTSSALFRVNAYTAVEFRQIEQQRIAAFIAFTTVIFAFFFWTLFELIRTRELVIGLFGISQLIGIGYTAVIFGFAVVLWPEIAWTDVATSLLAGGIGLFNLLLQGSLARLFRPAQWIRWLYGILMAAGVAVFVLISLQMIREAMTVLALYSLGVTALYLAWALTIDTRQPGGRLYRVIMVLQSMSLLPALLLLVGIPISDQILFYLIPLQQVWGTVLIGILLIRRAQYHTEEARSAQIAIRVMEAELLLEQAKRADQSRFMDMLVHELKTPIAVIRISLDTLAENTRPIQRSLRALENMTQILDRSASSLWIEHGAFQPLPETFTLNTLIRELLASTPDAERVDYQVSQSDRVMTDRMLLRTVLSNLVENALKYSPSQSPVTLSQRQHTPQRQGGVLITVGNQSKDLGGLDPQTVFEKFYRGPAARGRSGSGLGLYICQEIVRILGGTIQCHIEQDTIRVDLWIPRSISS